MSGIDTPSRPAAHLRTSSSGSLSAASGAITSSAAPTPPSPSIRGFSPGAPMPQGFSYLTRSHSLVTPTRRQVPQGMSSATPPSSQQPVKQLPALPSSASATDVARDSMLKRSRTVHEIRPASVPCPVPSLPAPQTPASARTLHRTRSEASNLAAMVAQLPSNPKQWTPSQVALYLAHVLGLTPRPIVEDVTAYVRQSGMSGRAFLRLREADLEAEGLNLKWRRLMIEAVRKLRRDCLKGRIWGFEGGSMDWPKSEADLDEERGADSAAPVPEERRGAAHAKGTLKRMREKKRVRQMIETFEGASDGGSLDEEQESASHHRAEALDAISRRSSSGESIASTPSPRQRMAPIYGEGYVRERAESFSNGATTEHPSRPELTQAQLEEWFGTMSEQEAAEAASELDEDELLALDEDLAELVVEERQRARRASETEAHGEAFADAAADESHDRSGSSSSSLSIDSLEQGPLTPPPLKFAPLEADVIQAIVGDSDEVAGDADDVVGSSPTAKKGTAHVHALGLGLVAATVPVPVHSLVVEDDIILDDPSPTHLRARPGSNGSAGRPANPYRSSTYDPADLEALGLSPEGDDEECKFNTARRIPWPPAAAARDDNEEAREALRMPCFDEVRAEESKPLPSARDLFVPLESATASVQPSEAQTPNFGSVRRRPLPVPPVETDELAALPPTLPSTLPATRQGTLSKGSKRSAQLAAILRASGVAEGPSVLGASSPGPGSIGRGYDGTMSRKGSRMGTMSKRTGPPPSAGRAASRMLELFSPAGSEVNSPAMDAGGFEAPPKTSGDGKPTEAQESPCTDRISVPLTTLEPTADGKGSIRKRSMVLVDRKRFEELAKRMGALEEQLQGLESIADGASSMADSDAVEVAKADDLDLEIADALVVAASSVSGASSGHSRMRTALDEVFAYPLSDASLRRQRENEARFQEELNQAEAQAQVTAGKGGSSFFGIPLSLGAIPAYALGLGAGVGFVLVSEVLGRATRR